ncbi:MAG: hypothetical protein UV74_C0013G0083 [Candidatus Woesebacteria bacterium GW2011_GWB1_43_14]|uniref:Uncharacterized protein n=1 Tax=Candidatus Woesebacteria bacterium GW2011_GWB1_43_14 TaxID=1618578 RepID=A0A0G1FPK6_9BACT|nr:MAG: hypothetical protein UT21_C0004G0028 [Candidatus Woesebacteria bacterium GW2011_GWA1_39_11b]KKS77731.1 MAG: hypothetical protein UV51_C0005G0141 [Candidatus Woesebacteria bacterium GW2011_GWC1_42_9]KKS96961.1 MAG: hypothetical protein UV74_C0013G0083 [Candidatus Woesebacteria bacterium GW2011_GWB1_43_14]
MLTGVRFNWMGKGIYFVHDPGCITLANIDTDKKSFEEIIKNFEAEVVLKKPSVGNVICNRVISDVKDFVD